MQGWVVVCLLWILTVVTFAKDSALVEQKIFYCNGAGRWFPEDGSELKDLVDGFLKSSTAVSKKPLAVIAPHAGYLYSGSGEGISYSVLKNKDIRRVIVIGPSHSRGFRGVSVLQGFAYYQTPLGKVKMDKAGTETLLHERHFLYDPAAHKPEHSVENQIPFIQRALPEAEIITCVVGFLEKEEMAEAGKSLAKLLDGNTVFAVSSDFTHYGRSFDYVPFTESIRNNLEKLDLGAIHGIETCDGDAFLRYIGKTGATICGRNAIALLLYALQGRALGRLLKYYTSSDNTGDFSHTVCYASIVMEQGKPEKKEKPMELTREDKVRLLHIARKYMESAVLRKPPEQVKNLPEKFNEDCGAFVTLLKKGELRGCIGYIMPMAPLTETVTEMAKAAALHDNRFMPVEPSELSEITIEISVLTPPVEIPSHKEFVVGKHGIVINLRGRQAVFLPQVAVEQKWDKETTLKHLCLKAGLGAEDYNNNEMTFRVFEAIVFGEKDLRTD